MPTSSQSSNPPIAASKNISRLDLPARLLGADVLRCLALLSIILLHVVLRDAQFAKAVGFRIGWFDELLVISTVFDNRSLAILSFFLLFKRDTAPYRMTIIRRAWRLLLPYLVWTTLYPLLELGLAAASGDFQAYLKQISQLRFWLSGYLLAATTEHLHFLPTLFLLTLLYPFYKTTFSLPMTITLLAVTSVTRSVAEFFIIGSAYSPSIDDLALLSGLRLVEYLPLGMFAYASSRIDMTGRAVSRMKGVISVIAVSALAGASMMLDLDCLTPAVGEAPGRLAWLSIQAVLGTVMMCLAVLSVLANGSAIAASPGLQRITQSISERALGIFVLHPLFITTFDMTVGAPHTYGLFMVVPKFLFVLICSYLSSSILIRTRGLQSLV